MHKFTEEQKQNQMERSGNFIDMSDVPAVPSIWETSLLEIILPIGFRDHAKINGMVFIIFPPPLKCQLTKSKIKTMLIAFFDSNVFLARVKLSAMRVF